MDFLSLSLRYGTGRSLGGGYGTRRKGISCWDDTPLLLFGDSGILMDKRCGAHVQLEDIQLGGFPFTNGGSFAGLQNRGFGVVNTSEHPRETEDFLQWLVSDEEALALQRSLWDAARRKRRRDRQTQRAGFRAGTGFRVDATGSDDTQRLLHETETTGTFCGRKRDGRNSWQASDKFLAGETGQP